MISLDQKAQKIINILLNGNISKEFLTDIGTDIEPYTLFKIVSEIKKNGAIPNQLDKLISQSDFPIFDIVGTGGIGSNKLNTSTLVSLYASCLGFQIIKHGGRSSSGKTGAVDFLEKMGASLEKLFQHANEYFRATNFVFLAAAYTYPIFAKSAPMRKQIQGPTLFNLLGPLLNPVQVKGKIIGVFNSEVALKIAETCKLLNETAVIVTSHDNQGYLDEASPYSNTILYLCKDKKINKIELNILENSDLDRRELFTDSIKVTEELLSSLETPATIYAKNLIAYNLSILHFLNELCFTQHEEIISDDIIKTKIISGYHIIRQNFNYYNTLALNKLNKIKNLSPVHEKSPIHISHNFSCNKQIQQKQVESFFAKEKLFFAEIKNKSPKNSLQTNLSLSTRLSAYKNADAISIVTHPSFSGSLTLLSEVRALTDKPILAKDFITKKEQIRNLVKAGANGILLLQDLLSEAQLLEFVLYCKELNVASFVESSFFIPKIGDFYILNSRSLFSLEENKHFRNYLLNYANDKTECNKIIIASNLETVQEINLCLKQYKGCIVGNTLMQLKSSIDIETFIAQAKEKRFTVKFCGARTVADLEKAINANVNMIGINLIPASKKFVGIENLEKMLPVIETHKDKICFITRYDIDLSCLKLIEKFNCNEQAYSFPMLPNRKNLLIANNNKYLTISTFLLDGTSPGQGIVEKYPFNYKQSNIPTLISNGLNPNNCSARFKEALIKGWNVTGCDCSTAICNENLDNQENAFSPVKIANMYSFIKGNEYEKHC